jgi:hypothetical protein
MCEDLTIEIEGMRFAHVSEVGLLRVFEVRNDRWFFVS